ncbi:hypothetical protein QFC20_000140 [Naganishia adeliensis]|uniref:Uncharacterized protein n=1 Tax=Naganishia adeliensis TaxID=92952 RepID=A0ACC2X2Q0_9TREE|nr:hypothetical protein QFC20_000140 [Naganishia adeliensis]
MIPSSMSPWYISLQLFQIKSTTEQTLIDEKERGALSSRQALPNHLDASLRAFTGYIPPIAPTDLDST